MPFKARVKESDRFDKALADLSCWALHTDDLVGAFWFVGGAGRTFLQAGYACNASCPDASVTTVPHKTGVLSPRTDVT